jgi:hypothetical protein
VTLRTAGIPGPLWRLTTVFDIEHYVVRALRTAFEEMEVLR